MQPADVANTQNAAYIDQLYRQYRQDPSSVPQAWQTFFAGFELGLSRSDLPPSAPATPTTATTAADAGALDLVHSYRELGHFRANLDPLAHTRPAQPLLDLENFRLSNADLDRVVGDGGFLGATTGTLRDLLHKLQLTYCSTIGVEFTGISDKAQREWLQERTEKTLNHPPVSIEQATYIQQQLIQAEEFEHYLQAGFVGKKRFSLEGGEALIPLLNTLIDHGSDLGAEQIIMAMAHRGRLNVLAHVVGKPYDLTFAEFDETAAVPSNSNGAGGDGDVKYHLGYARSRQLPDGRIIKLSLLPNPSHLELVDPIHQGIVCCKQELMPRGEARTPDEAVQQARRRVVPICLHGDAAFTGQGIVAETLNLSELNGYRTGGTIHIIVNNQIGYTTPPAQTRFTPYPTDVAKAIQAPIFHVNGDDPEAVVHVANMAIEFRQRFGCDVMIDFWCYRRYGHNEQDQADFTQPLEYQQIATHVSVRRLYAQRLISDGRATEQQLTALNAAVGEQLKAGRQAAKDKPPPAKRPAYASGIWKAMGPCGKPTAVPTAVGRDVLLRIARSQVDLPSTFTPHPKLVRQLQARFDAVESGHGIDWGCAEMLAFGTLLLNGTAVRLTGEDSERGTFAHRHAVLHDYKTGDKHIPLANLDPAQAKFTVLNTMLSELAVLGFECGFSSVTPNHLVLWEAQFGDFVNNAQTVIDQVLASTESKWGYANGLVLLLPHGYEGMGPDHCTAYLERFLALCAEDNMQVVVPSVPSQYFHVLRRQMLRTFRKPLILMMPKSLLRDTQRSSTTAELTAGSFRLVIDDPKPTDRDAIRRVLLCSGKVYWPLSEARDQANRTDIAVVRVEQLYPFPQAELEQVLASYRRKQDVCWVQEESKNRGAWSYIEPRLRALLPDTILSYIGRDESASPATASLKQHLIEEKELIDAALKPPGDLVPPPAPDPAQKRAAK